ncbi:MAG: hypothetical protein FGM24_04450 [Candidatus Kapabacteria bacterium]|nr:hypothetical protein [Candidatus Kapabacteria bacterium]
MKSSQIAALLVVLLQNVVLNDDCLAQFSASTRSMLSMGGSPVWHEIHDVNLLDGRSSILSLSVNSASRLLMLGYGTPEAIGKEPLSWYGYQLPATEPQTTLTFLANHRDISTVRCSTESDDEYRQIFSGSGGSSRILTTSFYGDLYPTKARFGDHYAPGLDQSSAVLFLNDIFNVSSSNYLNTADAGSNVAAFCAHKLAVEPIGWQQNAPLRTVHSYFLVGNGMVKPLTPEPPTSIQDVVCCGVIYGEARYKTWSSSIVFQAQNAVSYNVIDQVGPMSIRRWTKFHDGIIDIGGAAHETSPSRANETMCTEWRGIIVGAKKVYEGGVASTYGLVTHIDDLFKPVDDMTRIYEVSNLDGLLETAFYSVIQRRGSNGEVDGIIVGGRVKGIDSRFPNQNMNINSFASFIVIPGCQSQADANAPQLFVRVPGFGSDEVMSMTAMDNGRYAVVCGGNWDGEPDVYSAVYILHWDGTSLQCEAVLKPTVDMSLLLSDLVYAHGRLILAGKTSSASSAIIASEIGLNPEEVCGLRPVLFQSVTLSVSSYPRVLADEDAVVEPLLVSRVAPEVTEQYCNNERQCTTSMEQNGKVDKWGSHQDRGHAITFVDNTTIAHTGLCSGPFRLANVCDIPDCTPEMSQSTNFYTIRNLDCDLILTDNMGDYTLSHHGWYRLLITPEQFYGQCDVDPIPMYKGTSAFEIGYGIATNNGNLVVAGKEVETKPTASSDCPGPYGPLGDCDATLFSVKDLTGTIDCRALVFGKEHDDIPLSVIEGQNYTFTDKNFDLFAEEYQSDVINGISVYRPVTRSLEVFYGVASAQTPSLPNSSLNCAAGVTTTQSYATTQPDVASTSLLQRKGLLLGVSEFDNAESCSALDRVWARTITSNSNIDAHAFLQDVAATTLESSLHYFSVGGTQSRQGRYSRYSSDHRTWWTGVAIGSGLVVNVDEYGNLHNCAKVSMISNDCNGSSNTQIRGLIRLHSLTIVDENNDDVPDMIVAVGGCVPHPVDPEPGDPNIDAINKEYAFIIAMDMDFNEKWVHVLRPQQPIGSEFSLMFRDVVVDHSGTITAVGFGDKLKPAFSAGHESFYTTFTLDGNIVRSGVLLRKDDRFGSCDEPSERDNHIESIAAATNRTAVIGSTCRYVQPPVVNGVGQGCRVCNGEKGNRVGVVWDCPTEFRHYEPLSLTSIALDEEMVVGQFGNNAPVLARISVQKSVNPSTLNLSYQELAQPCDFIRLLNAEAVKEENDVDCPGGVDNNYDGGTVHAKATMYPTPCWPAP